MSKETLFEFINEIIQNEAARYVKGVNGLSRTSKISQKSAYETALDNNNSFGSFVHFSNLKERFGINPQTQWDTPFGIYGYPINLMLDKLKKIEVPYGGDSPWIHIFKAKNPSKLLNLKIYDENDYKRDTQKLYELKSPEFQKINNVPELLYQINKHISDYEPGRAVFYLTNVLSGLKKTKWSKLLKTIGYDGVYDPGYGIIHPNEPTQGLVFSSNDLEYIGVFPNPLTNNSNVHDMNYRDLKSSKKTSDEAWIDKYLKSLNELGFDNWIKTKEAKYARIVFSRLSETHKKYIIETILYNNSDNLLYSYKVFYFLNGKQPIENTFKFLNEQIGLVPGELLNLKQFIETLPKNEAENFLFKYFNSYIDFPNNYIESLFKKLLEFIKLYNQIIDYKTEPKFKLEETWNIINQYEIKLDQISMAENPKQLKEKLTGLLIPLNQLKDDTQVNINNKNFLFINLIFNSKIKKIIGKIEELIYRINGELKRNGIY